MRFPLLRAGLLGCALAPALLLGGCTKAASQLVIGVITNLSVSTGLDRVQLQVLRNDVQDGAPFIWDISDNPENRTYLLPGSFALNAENGSTPTVTVQLVGLNQGGMNPVVLRQSTIQFASEQELFYRMSLVESCTGNTGVNPCDDGLTCVEGICRQDAVNVKTLPAYAAAQVNTLDCDSGTRFIDTSTCAGHQPDCLPLQTTFAGCTGTDYCVEGTCYKRDPDAPRALEYGEVCVPGLDTCRLSTDYICANALNNAGDATCRHRCASDADCTSVPNPSGTTSVGGQPSRCIDSTDTGGQKVCTYICDPFAKTTAASGCFGGTTCTIVNDGKELVTSDCETQKSTDGTTAIGQACMTSAECVAGANCSTFTPSGGPAGMQVCHETCQNPTGSAQGTCSMTGERCTVIGTQTDSSPSSNTAFGTCDP